MIKDDMSRKNDYAHGAKLRSISGVFFLICLVSVFSVRLSAGQDHEEHTRNTAQLRAMGIIIFTAHIILDH